MRLSMRGRLAWSVRVGDRYVFSQDVEEVLWSHPELAAPDYQLIRHREQPQDVLDVRVAAGSVPAALTAELRRALSEQLEVPCDVALVDAESIARKGMKVERVRQL